MRNAIARFDQVEGVTDAERDRAWQRILAAAGRYDIEASADSWRDLFKGGKARKRYHIWHSSPTRDVEAIGGRHSG